jgi:hypothetical protein
MGLDLSEEWILFMWTRPAVKLLKNLALVICPFFLLGLILKVPRLLWLRMKILALALGSYDLTLVN